MQGVLLLELWLWQGICWSLFTLKVRTLRSMTGFTGITVNDKSATWPIYVACSNEIPQLELQSCGQRPALPHTNSSHRLSRARLVTSLPFLFFWLSLFIFPCLIAPFSVLANEIFLVIRICLDNLQSELARRSSLFDFFASCTENCTPCYFLVLQNWKVHKEVKSDQVSLDMLLTSCCGAPLQSRLALACRIWMAKCHAISLPVTRHDEGNGGRKLCNDQVLSATHHPVTTQRSFNSLQLLISEP